MKELGSEQVALEGHMRPACLRPLFYRVCHLFRLTKQVDYFWVPFDHFCGECGLFIIYLLIYGEMNKGLVFTKILEF